MAKEKQPSRAALCSAPFRRRMRQEKRVQIRRETLRRRTLYGRSDCRRKKREAEASLFALRLFAAGCGRKKGCRFGERRFVAVLCTAEAAVDEKREKPRLLSLLCAFSPQDAAGKKDADSARGASSPYSVRQKRLSTKKERSRGFSLCSAPFLRRITLHGIRRRQSG